MSEDEQAGPSRQPAAQRGGGRRRGRDEMEGGEDAAAAGAGDGTRSRKRQRRATGGWRPYVNYAWLSVSAHTPGVYVPQARQRGQRRGSGVAHCRHLALPSSASNLHNCPSTFLAGRRRGGVPPRGPPKVFRQHQRQAARALAGAARRARHAPGRALHVSAGAIVGS